MALRMCCFLTWVGLFTAGCGGDSASEPAGIADAGTDVEVETEGGGAECVGGAKKCSGSTPQTCEDGSWVDGPECEYGCEAGACLGQCVPGTMQCTGTSLMTCNDESRWTLGEECPYLCMNGACTGECTPGHERCLGNTPQTCDIMGNWISDDPCPYACVSGGCAGSCVPGTLQCNGDIAQECGDLGSWNDLTECPFLCAAGECIGECEPGTTDCIGDTQRSCDATGHWVTGAACSGAKPVCFDGGCVHASTHGPSCAGLVPNCGPGADMDCCEAAAVPGGTFNRSNDPAAPASVSEFSLDVFETTVGRFRRFVDDYEQDMTLAGAGKNPNNPADPGWDTSWNANMPTNRADLVNSLSCDYFSTWTDVPAGNENRPINCVSWYLAFAYCVWDGGRLPTEAEWNYAAAGGVEQRVYPWSNPPDSTTISESHASYKVGSDCNGDGLPGCEPADLVVVGSKPAGNARWGHADVAGNVFEWALDSFEHTYPTPCDDCASLNNNLFRAFRGGSFFGEDDILMTTYRSSTQPHAANAALGIRCARLP